MILVCVGLARVRVIAREVLSPVQRLSSCCREEELLIRFTHVSIRECYSALTHTAFSSQTI